MLKATLSQFNIPSDVKKTLKNLESIVDFIGETATKLKPQKKEYIPSAKTSPKLFRKRQILPTLEKDDVPCIDNETEKFIESITNQLNNPYISNEEEQALIKAIKKLTIKIHPDKTIGKPYQKRCEELFKILSNFI
jgi:hypothetical protein